MYILEIFPYSILFPQLPGRIAFLPHLFQLHLVTLGIHTFPETVVAVYHQLSVLGKLLQRRFLKDGIIALDIVKDARFEYHEAAVDDLAVIIVLLTELADVSVAVNIHDTETLSDVDAGQGRDLAVLLVECHQRIQIHVGNAVARRSA